MIDLGAMSQGANPDVGSLGLAQGIQACGACGSGKTILGQQWQKCGSLQLVPQVATTITATWHHHYKWWWQTYAATQKALHSSFIIATMRTETDATNCTD